jgi:60 kDa SS-A/Ro ribonucleoprotein
VSKALDEFGSVIRQTPQSEPVFGRSDQVRNSAGGFVFQVDHWTRLHRFLVLGSDGGTYYVKQKELTKENATAVLDCLKDDGIRTVDFIVGISENGRAPKNDQAIFSLALALTFGDLGTKRKAEQAVPSVCRTGTHIFQLTKFLKSLGGFGTIKRRAIASWYLGMEPERLAYQLVKYRQREGFTHHDVLHLCHAKPEDEAHDALFHWAKEQQHDVPGMAGLPEICYQHLALQGAERPQDAALRISRAAQQGITLPRESVPTEHANSPEVQMALLEAGMPMTAMIRNLGNMTKSGLLSPMSEAEKLITAQLANTDQLRAARVHPLAVLTALKTYASGGGFRSSSTWTPNPRVVDALDAAFYESFGNVEPIDNNVMLALDVSGSMSSLINNTNLSAAEGSCALAMVMARTEPSWMVTAFTSGYNHINHPFHQRSAELSVVAMSPRERLDDLVRRTQAMTFGATDCALPMLMAAQENWPIDTFIIYTDSETWAGMVHPYQALENYRQKSGRNAKLVVVGMTSNGFSIADPRDPEMLDVVGFDTAVPTVISDFARGE